MKISKIFRYYMWNIYIMWHYTTCIYKIMLKLVEMELHYAWLVNDACWEMTSCLFLGVFINNIPVSDWTMNLCIILIL